MLKHTQIFDNMNDDAAICEAECQDTVSWKNTTCLKCVELILEKNNINPIPFYDIERGKKAIINLNALYAKLVYEQDFEEILK